ncbi:MAG: DUF6519 domain-containing protein [Pseudomonadota bacterium]
MKGDFTRFSYDPQQRYSRVLKQQGRVDLDADWNEAIEIFTQLERSEARDVIGPSGVPEASNGYRVIVTPGGELAVTRGRIYVHGIQCSNELDPHVADPEAPLLLNDQEDLPGYELPLDDGVYLAYVDVWERHITYIEDPDIREVALGGPDTTTRTRTLCQVKLEPLNADGPLSNFECQPYPALPNTGRLAARSAVDDEPETPCVVPAGGGYRGLENRLYRVEIHDDGRDEDGNLVGTPTFKWSRDNGSVVLPVAEGGIDGDDVTLTRFGPDDVLTVQVGNWVEVLGDETELFGRHGALGQIEPNGIDRADREITLSEDVSVHGGESHLKVRRWDHQATDTVALQDGALPIQGDWFELEDGVEVRFDTTANYNVGDYWVIPARTREGDVQWPQEGGLPADRRRLGIQHHYSTLALVRRFGGVWTEVEDCRDLFPPLTEVDDGCCCVRVEPGEDIQQAIDTVVGAGGGCVSLCQGLHEVDGPLRIRNGRDVVVSGQGPSTVVRLRNSQGGDGGLVMENSHRVRIDDMMLISGDVRSLITAREDADWGMNRSITLAGLLLINSASSARADNPRVNSALRLGHCDGVVIDNCRMAAEVGMVALWNDTLPSLDPDGAGGTDAPFIALGFENLELGSEFRVGDSFTEAGVLITGETFVWGNGTEFGGGFARVDDGNNSSSTGQDMGTNNINLNFALPTPFSNALLDFGEFGGNINLRINGELANVNGMAALDGLTLGGVSVSVVFTDESQVRGRLVMQADAQPIASLSVGGQELWLDNVIFRGNEPGEEPDLRYGNGVNNLRMTDSVIRYVRMGVMGAVCANWHLQRDTLLPLQIATINPLVRFLEEAETAADYTTLKDNLEPVWNSRADLSIRDGTTAFGAFVLWEAKFDQCTLGGSTAVYAFWAIRSRLTDCRLSAFDTGLNAFWLHQCRVRGCRFEQPSGIAVLMAGSYRTRFTDNDLRSADGILNLPLGPALGYLLGVHGVLAAAYGVDDEIDGYVLYWMMLESSLRIMGLALTLPS